MNLFKKTTSVAATALLFSLASHTVMAKGWTHSTTIEDIIVNETMVRVKITPSLTAGHTVCSNKTNVEIVYPHLKSGAEVPGTANRDVIMNLATAAMLSGKQVNWITTDNCSNVGADEVRGLKILN